MPLTNKFFAGIQHLHFYCQESIIRYKGELIMVTRSGIGDDGERRLFYFMVGDQNETQVSLNFDDEQDSIDFSPIPLGMVNMIYEETPQAFYVGRRPARQWKVGLSVENVVISSINSLDRIPARRTVLNNKALIDTVNRDYPGIEEALSQVTDKESSVAFHHSFAVGHGGRLFFQDMLDVIGHTKPGSITLFEDYSWLKEMLEEVVECPVQY